MCLGICEKSLQDVTQKGVIESRSRGTVMDPAVRRRYDGSNRG